MTRNDWWDDDAAPHQMFRLLNTDKALDPRVYVSTPYKIRLFHCACCRLAWGALNDECRRAVQVAEDYFNGLVTVEELESTFRNLSLEYPSTGAPGSAKRLIGMTARRSVYLSSSLTEQFYWEQASPDYPVPAALRAHLIRSIFNDPFRVVALANNNACPRCQNSIQNVWITETGEGPEWLRKCASCYYTWVPIRHEWLTDDAVELVQRINDERWQTCGACGGTRQQRYYGGTISCEVCDGTGKSPSGEGLLNEQKLGVLADMLYDAGCTEVKTVCRHCKPSVSDNNVGITTPWSPCRMCNDTRTIFQDHPLVAHLRDPRPHVLGDHVIDIITGRRSF